MTQRIELSYSNLSQRIKLFWKKKDDSKNWFFQLTQKLNFLKLLKELNMTQRIDNFFNMTQRIEPSFEDVSMELNLFFRWLNDLILFFLKKKCDLQEFNLVKNMTQRIELFCFIQRIEPLFWKWLTELHIFKYDSQKCDLIELFFDLTQKLNFLNDSKNWTLFVNMIQEENLFFFRYAYKNWTLFSNISLQELNFVRKRPKELNAFFWRRSLTQRFFLSKNWLKELNFFSYD